VASDFLVIWPTSYSQKQSKHRKSKKATDAIADKHPYEEHYYNSEVVT